MIYNYRVVKSKRDKGVTKMKIKVTQDAGELIKASANYLKDLECYEVELIKNPIGYGSGHDTTYRIEMIDNDYIDITINELRGLKKLLNDKEVCELLKL